MVVVAVAAGAGAYNWCNNAGPGRALAVAATGGQCQPRLDPAPRRRLPSDNKGTSWTLISNCNARPMYFSQLRVDPSNDKTIYVAGFRSRSRSMAERRLRRSTRPADMAIRPRRSARDLDRSEKPEAPDDRQRRRSRHLWDQGKTWDYVNTMATALAYWCHADMRHPYYVYTGLQDNGSWGGPSATRTTNGILNSDWFGIGGGDGFQTGVDPTDYNVVYTESQDGNTNRYDLRTGRSDSIRPRGPGERGRGFGGARVPRVPGVLRVRRVRRVPRGAAPGAAREEQTPRRHNRRRGHLADAVDHQTCLNAGPNDAYRFNWNTPFMLSPHNPSIVWLGGNRLFKSYNRGDTWIASPDLTKNIDRNTVALMGVPGDRTNSRRTTGSSPTARSFRSRNHPCCRASYGPAPTMGTCR